MLKIISLRPNEPDIKNRNSYLDHLPYIEDFVDQAGCRGADIIILPEDFLFQQGLAESFDGPICKMLSQKAKKYKANVIGTLHLLDNNPSLSKRRIASTTGTVLQPKVARWCHLPDMDVKPEIVAVCDANTDILTWYTDNFATITQVTSDYKELLANDAVEAVYIAVPHNLHQEFYCAAIEAGKHLLGEKPFGIDKTANDAIMACIAAHPDVFVRCSSESPFFPAMQRIGQMIEADAFGRIIEVNSGFLHCSDMDTNKPINWKRKLEFNGEYGCMGDLGMHACHMPFRAGWVPKDVRAILSDLVPERPDGKGGMAPCETWDNATLFCTAEDGNANPFPLTIKTQRIAPGNKNTWYLEILGSKGSARWSSKQINTLETMEYSGGEQAWQVIDMGHEMAHKSITGGIFEAGFSDSILQMWAAFLYELEHGGPIGRFAGCVTPEESALSHKLFTAALASQQNVSTEQV